MGSCLSLGDDKRTVLPPRGIDVIAQDVSTDLKDSQHDVVVSSTDGDVVHFTHWKLRLATRDFRQDHLIHKGIHGTVFRGVIDSRTVAIKVPVHPFGLRPLENKEWLKEEVNYLGQLRHPNIVRLIGYCCEEDHRLFVYEHMPSGSLDKQIYSSESNPLTWLQRMKIGLGAAKGLNFIHNAERKIRFRDFKTAKILLDEDLNAKLSGFGLTGDLSHVSDRTAGYADPAHINTGYISAELDVYGFGVVLLEMLAGRCVIDNRMHGEDRNLVEWGRPKLMKNTELLKLLDPRMSSLFPRDATEKVAELTYQCLSKYPGERPDMSQVIRVLEAVVQTEEA